jgi:hypothetical protein
LVASPAPATSKIVEKKRAQQHGGGVMTRDGFVLVEDRNDKVVAPICDWENRG